MTKQELINFIDERIHRIKRIKTECFQKGYKLSSQYFEGQCEVYNQLRILVEDLDEPKTKIIEVKTLYYSNLYDSLKESTKRV